MPALPSFQASLFFGAAFAHLAVVPKHLYVGSTLIRKTIESIPDRPDIATGKALIGTLWDYGNAFLVVTGKCLPAHKSRDQDVDDLLKALLNIKWARHGAPKLVEDKLAIAATWLAGLYIGMPYYTRSMYLPVVMLWVAPPATAVACML